MKKVLPLFMILLVSSACGNSRFSNEQNPLRAHEAQSNSNGLLLSVRNNLPEEQIGEDRVRPNLNAFFCSPMPQTDQIPPTEERCIQLTGVIRNGDTETFHVTREQLATVFQRGNGYGTFEFSDNYQLTVNPWHCYIPNHRVRLSSNFDSRQDWQVEVNQRFAASYGCIINH